MNKKIMNLIKHLIAVIMIISGFSFSYSQTFFKDGTKYLLTYWRTKGSTDVEQWTFTDSIRYVKTMNDTEYYSLTHGLSQLKQINKRVFFSENKLVFYLIYDFNLKTGDTLKGQVPSGPGEINLKIDSIRYLEYGGQIRKTQFVRGISGIDSVNLTFVEGIGSLEAGIEHYKNWIFEEGLDLESVCSNDTLLHKVDWIDINIACDFDSVYKLMYNSVLDNFPEQTAQIYPNPFTDYCLIILPQTDYREKQFSLFSATGNVVFTDYFSSNKYQFNRAGLPEGIYLYVIQSDEKTYKGKLIITN